MDSKCPFTLVNDELGKKVEELSLILQKVIEVQTQEFESEIQGIMDVVHASGMVSDSRSKPKR